MASTKIKLRKDKVKSDGTAHLVIQIIHNRKSTELSLGRSIPIENWDEGRQRVIGKIPNKAAINAYIDAERRRIDQMILLKQALKVQFDVKDVVAESRGVGGKRTEIISLLDKHINENQEGLSYNTLRTYISTRAAIKEYAPKLTLHDLTTNRLEDFESFLRKTLGNGTNTIHGRMKVLRKICNTALRDGIITQYPFRDFKLKTQRVNRNYLTQEDIMKLINARTNTDLEQLVKDTFLFGCFTGLRFSDICLLTKENMKDGDKGKQLSFRIAKTQDPIVFV